MADKEAEQMKSDVKDGTIALPLELIPIEVVRRAIEMKVLRLQSLPELLQRTLIQSGLKTVDNVAEDTVKAAIQEVSELNKGQSKDQFQPQPSMTPELPKEKDYAILQTVKEETGRPGWVERYRLGLGKGKTVDKVNAEQVPQSGVAG
jgi:hypothetical protein